jgi:hypothetical protein
MEGVDTHEVPEGEDFTGDTQIVRWATDPAGRVCQISAEVPGPPDWPMFTADADDGLVSRLLLWRANRGIRKAYERGERRHSGPPIWYLEVWRHDGDGKTMIVDEEIAGGPHEARLRVHELATQVAAGIVKETDD